MRLAVAAADNVRAPRGVLLLITGGPGQPGVPALARIPKILGAELHDYRVVVYDQRGTGAGALDCPALQSEMGSSDLWPAAGRRPSARAPGSSARTAAVLRHGRRRRRHGVAAPALGADRWTLDGISYGSYVGERYALAHPDACSGSCSTRSSRMSARPTSAWSSSGRRRACFARSAVRVRRRPRRGRARAPQRRAAARRPDAPEHRRSDLPHVVRRARGRAARGARRQPHRPEQLPRDGSPLERDAGGGLDQGLHASALCADWRYPWGSSAAPLAGREAKLRRAVAKLVPARASRRSTGRRPPAPGSCGSACRGRRHRATPLDRRKLTVPTLLVNGDHDLSTPLEWARQELALTTRGKLVVVPGAGHSTQSRAVSDVARNAVASFLLGSS